MPQGGSGSTAPPVPELSSPYAQWTPATHRLLEVSLKEVDLEIISELPGTGNIMVNGTQRAHVPGLFPEPTEKLHLAPVMGI